MQLSTYQCEICASDKLKEEVFLVKLNFREKPRRIEKAVDEWYSGIRIVCKECAKGLGKLSEQESSDAPQPRESQVHTL